MPRLRRAFRGFKPIRPFALDPPERPASSYYPLVNERASDLSRDRFVYQPRRNSDDLSLTRASDLSLTRRNVRRAPSRLPSSKSTVAPRMSVSVSKSGAAYLSERV